MTLSSSIQTVFRKYVDFDGRAGLAEFWWWVLFTVLVSAALNTTLVWTSFLFAGNNPWSGSPFAGPSIAGLWGVAVLLPSLAVTVRRLRDAGFQWAHIFWLLLPGPGTVVLIILCAQPSKPGPVPAVETVRPVEVGG
jgi:uncharacterized membrane protein YhaH (DUF805 family)